jgi:hypothetical protein
VTTNTVLKGVVACAAVAGTAEYDAVNAVACVVSMAACAAVANLAKATTVAASTEDEK